MYAILGSIIGLSISSAIICFQNSESVYGVKFTVLSILSVIALVLLFVKES